MKSRSSSPQTSPQIVRRFRVDSISGTAASSRPRKSSIRVEEVSSSAMTTLSPPRAPAASNSLSPISHNLRRSSSETFKQQTPARDTLQGSSNNLTPFTNVSSPGSENSPATWSSAVGPATASGKSGRVIERLMTENDKLKRDLNAQVIKCQELEKSMQTYRPQIEALRHENDNLSHARDVDSSLIARRDRKIEELKADLASERSRREAAEEAARTREREKDEHEEYTRRELQTLTESTKHATVHAEILETSHKQLGAEYRTRAEAWKRDLTRLNDGRERDRQKLAKLDVVADHMRQELERNRKLNAEMVETWERYRRETDSRVESMEEQTEQENEKSRLLSAEMERVIGEMRWLMGLKKNMRSLDTVEDTVPAASRED